MQEQVGRSLPPEQHAIGIVECFAWCVPGRRDHELPALHSATGSVLLARVLARAARPR